MQLVVDNLELKRGSRTIVRDLSFAVAGGEALLLTGANGAGKTTLIRALAGLLRPAAGEIRLEGGDAEHEVPEQCHYVGHLNSIKASLTAAETLAFWADYLGDGSSGTSSLPPWGEGRGKGDLPTRDDVSEGPLIRPSATFSPRGEGKTIVGAERVLDALDRFNLMELADIPAGYMSAGQKRRLGLARLVVATRPVWLLDEPTVSLDKDSVKLLARVVDAHVAGGGIVVAATHLDLGLSAPRELNLSQQRAAA